MVRLCEKWWWLLEVIGLLAQAQEHNGTWLQRHTFSCFHLTFVDYPRIIGLTFLREACRAVWSAYEAMLLWIIEKNVWTTIPTKPPAQKNRGNSKDTTSPTQLTALRNSNWRRFSSCLCLSSLRSLRGSVPIYASKVWLYAELGNSSRVYDLSTVFSGRKAGTQSEKVWDLWTQDFDLWTLAVMWGLVRFGATQLQVLRSENLVLAAWNSHGIEKETRRPLPSGVRTFFIDGCKLTSRLPSLWERKKRVKPKHALGLWCNIHYRAFCGTSGSSNLHKDTIRCWCRPLERFSNSLHQRSKTF